MSEAEIKLEDVIARGVQLATDTTRPIITIYAHDGPPGMTLSIEEWRALLSAAEEALALRERLARLEGRLCLICGAKEPCALNNTEMSPCTFDPDPIEAARAFMHARDGARKRAKKAESELAALRERLREARHQFQAIAENAEKHSGWWARQMAHEGIANLARQSPAAREG